MDKLDKELLLLFEESDNIPKLNYIKENLKHHKLFKKFVKICIDFKIKLFDVIEDRYIVKNKEKLIKSVFQKMITVYHLPKQKTQMLIKK